MTRPQRPRTAPTGTAGRADKATGVRTPRFDAGGRSGRSQTLVFNGFPSVSQAKMLGPNGGTWSPYVVNRVRKRIHETVKMLALLQEIRPMRPPVLVTLRYVFGEDRQRDADNFAVVGKPVIDGLVRAGVLEGDDAKRLTERVEFVVERGARRLEVILEEVLR
jgi:hypothetical protein